MRGGEDRYIDAGRIWQITQLRNYRSLPPAKPLACHRPPGPKSLRMTGRTASLRLFRVFGIDVYLHSTWFFVAAYQVIYRSYVYVLPGWSVAEYLALFLIILVRQVAQGLACRRTGRIARRILLSPLGGVVYVSPARSPVADLWSIPVGPLVNALFFVIFWLVLLGYGAPAPGDLPDVRPFLRNLCVINLGLLIFNLLPIYPLDGGRLLRALLWFPLGRARSLKVAIVIGFLGVAALTLWAVNRQLIWIGIVAFYLFWQCVQNWKGAEALLAVERLPRRTDFACPWCAEAPPIGAFWHCRQCRTAFDAFETQDVCPVCHTASPTTTCGVCRASHPISAWRSTAAPSGGN